MTSKSSRQLYKKLMYICSAVIIGVVLALVIYFVSSTRLSILEKDLDYTRMLSEDVANYINDSSNITDNIVTELYRRMTALNDLIHYFEDDEETYMKYRLDTYMTSGLGDYSGIDDFMESIFDAYDTVMRVTVISNKQEYTTTYFPNQRVLHSKNKQVIMRHVQSQNLAAEGEFSFVKEIRRPDTWENIGCIIVTYKTDKLKALHDYYSKAELLVYNTKGTYIFQSEKMYVNNKVLLNKSSQEMEEKLKAYVEWKETKGYSVLSYIDKKEAGYIPFSTMVMILFIGIAVIAFGEAMIKYYLKDLAKRLNYILDGMEKVQTGDLSVRLDGDGDGDELDIISSNFNEMCRKLDDYIQKSYLAEIERKNAEMEALQSQINPHFLYNTLEVIRMKAICNGDKEVGKMLYTMAVIYRSQIKEADVITLIQELHYCKKYLELFEYRYQSQFVSQVVCPEEYMDVPIIKFILQPILENYFIHGMRTESKDNFIYIGVSREEDDMVIIVEDNGRGMSEADIEQRNAELRENKNNAKKSIGISNVNRRLKAVYGTEYGVTLEKSPSGGLRVKVKFKANGSV